MKNFTPIDNKRLVDLAKCIRLRSLKMALDCGKNGSHLGSAFSAVEILTVLYGHILDISVQNPLFLNRDRLIVSKGHCVLAYYVALKETGFLNEKDLLSFETNGSHFHGHATRNVNFGIEFSGGSLGLGMSFGAGVALAGKMNNSTYKVYVLIGDGECNEGIVWEAFMLASHYQLDNLTVIVDDNKLQYDGESSSVMNMGSLEKKFDSFGFSCINVDGHSINDLVNAFNSPNKGKPKIIIADTVKGKGVSFMEGKKEWHHSRLTEKQYELALSEILNS
jgi:transketolase